MNGEFDGNPDSALEAAIEADDRLAVAAALAAGAAVDARGPGNLTPLMLAVGRGKARAAAELLARGADPNLRADDGTSAVSLAVDGYRQAPEILSMILRGGGDPNARGPNGDPVIMRFLNDRNCEYVRRMKAWGADLDILTRGGDPIITEAAVGQDWDLVWCLIELGARYDYERHSRQPLAASLSGSFPAADSPLYPYKVKVWEHLKAHGIAVPSLDR